MSAFLYGVALQWKLDIRSRALLITCYIVPLLFFAVMGGIFTSLIPGAKDTLIQSMTVMGVTTGAFVGLPPSLTEIYGSDIKKSYLANGVPLYLGLVALYLSAFMHLMIMSLIIYITAPLVFGAALPGNPAIYFLSLAIFTAVSLGVGCVIGLAVKSQVKLTMISQVVYLPSLMLSGIMFSADLLPKVLNVIGKVFPASWGFPLICDGGLILANLLPLLIIFAVCVIVCILLLRRTAEN